MSGKSLNSVLVMRRGAKDETTPPDQDVRHDTKPAVRTVGEAQAPTAETTPKAEPAAAPLTARERSAEAPAVEAPAKKGAGRKTMLLGIGALALIAGAYYGYNYITVGRFTIS